MANTFKFGNGNWAVKDGQALAYNDENNNFKPLPFDFTRASSATRVNKQGLIETVPSGKPRIDFLDNTSGHLLLEPSRTNTFQRSEELDNAYWSKATGISVTANQAVSPDGNTTAEKVILDSGTNAINGGLYRSLSTSSSTKYALSFFAKKGEYRYGTVAFGSTAANGFHFDLEDGVILSEFNSASNYTNISKQMIDYGNGWYRLIVVTQDDVGSGRFLGIRPHNEYPTSSNNNYSSTGDGTSGIYVWGAQLEVANGYATSYIPTEGSSVTRSAETGVDCLLPNETIVDNSTATVYLEFEALANDASNRWISFEEVGVATDNLFTFRLAAASNLIQIVSRSAGGGQDVVMSETLTDVTANNKIAFNYDGLNWKLAVNGSITDTATAARLFNDNIEKIKFSRYANTNYFYGKVKDLKVYNTALTDTELQNLTS